MEGGPCETAFVTSCALLEPPPLKHHHCEAHPCTHTHIRARGRNSPSWARGRTVFSSRTVPPQTVYADFEDYDTGIYTHVTGGPVGGHAVKIVGWGKSGDTEYWKIANSWNPYWGARAHPCPAALGVGGTVPRQPHTAPSPPARAAGEKGYFRIKMGTGGIDSECIASSADSTYKKGGGGGSGTCSKMCDGWCHDKKGKHPDCEFCLTPHMCIDGRFGPPH